MTPFFMVEVSFILTKRQSINWISDKVVFQRFNPILFKHNFAESLLKLLEQFAQINITFVVSQLNQQVQRILGLFLLGEFFQLDNTIFVFD